MVQLFSSETRCLLCNKILQGKILCERCAQKIDPMQKAGDRPWWEPSRRKVKRQHKHRRRELTPSEFTSIFLQILQVDQAKAAKHNWAAELQAFIDAENHHMWRIEWFAENGKRYHEVKTWIEGLTRQDAATVWNQIVENRGRPRRNSDDIVMSDDQYDRLVDSSKDYEGYILNVSAEEGIFSGYLWESEWDEELDSYYEAMRDRSRQKFFGKVYDLTDEEFLTLQVVVHQLRIIRNKGTERAFTSKDAAAMLSQILSKNISAAAYRKRVERLKAAMDLDIELWVKYRYL